MFDFRRLWHFFDFNEHVWQLDCVEADDGVQADVLRVSEGIQGVFVAAGIGDSWVLEQGKDGVDSNGWIVVVESPRSIKANDRSPSFYTLCFLQSIEESASRFNYKKRRNFNSVNDVHKMYW